MKPGKPSEYSGRLTGGIHVNVKLDEPRGLFVLEGGFKDEYTTSVLGLGGKAVEALATQLEAGESVIDQVLKPIPDSPGSYAVAEEVSVHLTSTRGADIAMRTVPGGIPLVIREYPLPAATVEA